MKKIISACLLALISMSVFSQDNSLLDISQKVKDLIARHGDSLDQNDQLLVRKNLRQILNVFKVNGYDEPSNNDFICDASNNKLMNLSTGWMIHDFNSSENCNEALSNVKVGKGFCDYSSNVLKMPDGKFVHDFNESQNCKDAVESIFKVKKFCDYSNNTLRRADGWMLYDFNSKEECLKGLGL